MAQTIRDSLEDNRQDNDGNDLSTLDSDTSLIYSSMSASPAPAFLHSTARHAPFALLVSALVAVTLLLFAQVADAMQARQSYAAASANFPQQPTPLAQDVALPSNVKVTLAQMRYYPTSDPRASLMQPVVDRKGYVWFGEMRANKLARLDPNTGEIREWDPPSGRYGLMMSTLGPDGAIWFTEDNAGYIGRFDPSTERFTTYPLAPYDKHSPGPQHLLFDQAGQLWFTLQFTILADLPLK
jgi:streptogramin lyase